MTDFSKYRDFVVKGYRFYTNKNTGKNVMKHVIDNCPEDKFVVAQSHEYSRKGESRIKKYCKYGAVADTEFSELLKEDFQIYDVMQTTEKFPYLRIVFDIDLKGKDVIDPLQGSIAVVKEKFPDAILNISGSIAETKEGHPRYSYHIVLFNYAVKHIDDYALVQKLCLQHKSLGFDPSIYRMNGQYKCVNQSKQDGRIQKVILGSVNPLDHSLRCNIPDDIKTMADSTLSNADFPKEIKKRGRPRKVVVDGEEKKKPRLLTTPEQEVNFMDIPVPDKFDIYSASPLDKLNAFPNPIRSDPHQRSYNLNMMIARWCKHVGISFREFWKWCKQKEDTVERQEKYKAMYLNLQCEYIRDTFMQTLLVLAYGSKILKDTNIDKLKELYKVPCDILLDKKYLETSDVLDALRKNSVVFIDWPLGGGKTSTIMSLIHGELVLGQIKKAKVRILFVTCRIALTKEQQSKLPASFISYLNLTNDVKKLLNDFELFACSVQSLHLVQADYDIIIFDEVETILTSFNGKCTTHKVPKEDRLRRHWNTLVDLIRYTPRIIAMDGILSKMSIDFFKAVRPSDPPVVIQSTQVQSPRQVRLCKNIETLYNQIHQAIDAGKKIFVGMSKKGDKSLNNMDSVEGLKAHLLARYPEWKNGVQVRAFHSDAQAEKEKLINCEDELGHPNTRVWIGNSSIAVGVSYDPHFDEKHEQFDMIFASLDVSCMSHHDFFQLLYRVRKPKESLMFVHLNRINPLSREAKINDEPNFPPTDNIWKNLRANLALKNATDYQSKNRQTFKLFCKMLNVDIVEGSMLTITEEEIDQVKKAFDGSTHSMFRWDKIKMLTEREYKRLLEAAKHEVLTVDESLSINKYTFREKFHDENVAEDYWQAGVERTFMERTHELLCYENNITDSISWLDHYHQCRLISHMLKSNNLTVGDGEGLFNLLGYKSSPKNFPFSEISKHFKLRITNYRSDIWYKMFFAFFGSDKVISKNGRGYIVGEIWDGCEKILKITEPESVATMDDLKLKVLSKNTVAQQSFFPLTTVE